MRIQERGIYLPGSEPMNRTCSTANSSFWKQYAALAILSGLLLSVCLPGFAVLYQPLRELPAEWCLVTELERLPASGEPIRYPLLQVSRDAWETHAPQPVSSAYLRRLPNSDRVVALSAMSPWSACHLVFNQEQDCFSSCCHLHDDYDLLGRRLGSDHPARRDMDQLETVIRDGQVWVKYEQFESSIGMSK
jgi:menaquinol-cytochrome c reductase iron-sulfur subunit